MLPLWENLPDTLRNDEVFSYYAVLQNKKTTLFLKRIFDILGATFLIIILSPIMLVTALIIKAESKGDAIFKQLRITAYKKDFYIYKFRTMVINAESLGSQVTIKNDSRITNVGAFLRKYRIDEFPQLFNILKGEMSFVGTRPEVPKYVDHYTNEMLATLLLPAGVTSLASVEFKDEEKLLQNATDPDTQYIKEILPQKMQLNLHYLKTFSLRTDINIIFKTIKSIFFKFHLIQN